MLVTDRCVEGAARVLDCRFEPAGTARLYLSAWEFVRIPAEDTARIHRLWLRSMYRLWIDPAPPPEFIEKEAAF